MNIFFRVDSSDIIGTGHIIRCLKFANYYKNYNIYFISKKFKHNINCKITENNFILNEISIKNTEIDINNSETWLGEPWENDCNKTIDIIKNKKVDWLIIDQYGIDFKWQSKIKPYVKNLLVIDDYIERKHNSDYLLNNVIDNNTINKVKYINYINKECKLLLGSNYIFFSEDFFKYSKIKKFNNTIKRVNIFISGSDYDNYTLKIIQLLSNKFNNIIFDIIIGGSNKNYKLIENYCKQFINFNFYHNINNIPEILSKSDLSIGSIGQSFYERLILKIPSIVFTIADNQLEIYDKYKNDNLFIYCGHKMENCQIIIDKLRNITNNKEEWDKMIYCCTNISNKFINKNYIKDIIR